MRGSAWPCVFLHHHAVQSGALRRLSCAFLRWFTIGALSAVAGVQAQPGITERVSVSSAGQQGDDFSAYASISADGRYVAFVSVASNLVPGDTDETYDVFVRDRLSGFTERVSVSSSGEQVVMGSAYPCISGDGRLVVFDSSAPNLVPGDTNRSKDVFVRDRLAGTTERVSVSSAGEEANEGSWDCSVSRDGRFVAFCSKASNLVPDDTNGWEDVFVRDMLTGTTERVSVSSVGEQGDLWSRVPVLSGDGRYVAFGSCATNLAPGDTNGEGDVYVRDRLIGTTERVSLSSSGGEGNNYSWLPAISADGLHVAFVSRASNLVPDDTNGCDDVFVRDLLAGTCERVSVSSFGVEGNRHSGNAAIGADGRYVVFHSRASNLVAGETHHAQDIFVRDRLMGVTERVSVSSSGEQGDRDSWFPAVSADGRFVAFDSLATNLVPDDTNAERDVFVRDRLQYPVSGRVAFQDLDASATPHAFVEARVTWNGEFWGKCEAELSPEGCYSISLPCGLLTLSIKCTHWLRQTLPVDTTEGPVSGVDFSLVNGDALADNAVDLRDLARVLFRLGTSDPSADLDEDGCVGFADLEIVYRNFGTIGEE
jgi:Tol biopolymer transport system component